MDRKNAVDVLCASFSEDTSTPSLGAADRKLYIKECQESLLNCMVDPVKVDAYTTQWTRENTEFKNDIYQMFLIARNESRELLYNTEAKEFSLAIRNDKGKLYLVGYSSADALAEWLG